jgi:hypothetical protein
MSERNIKGFKKFSELKKTKVAKEDELLEVTPSESPDTDSDRPMFPNLPDKGQKIERPAPTDAVQPEGNTPLELGRTATEKEDEPVDESKQVKFYGKVAKFPDNTKASKTLNFLENVKISKNSIWYILVEKQNNELQMLKYNNKQGVDMMRFVNELKTYYLEQYKADPKVCQLIENISINGATEFSSVQNIPNIVVGDNKKLITKITEDLIKLLSI